MTSPDAMRASDGDRERVVQALQEQVGEGRLTLEEFEERSGAVYEAKTVGDLRKLTADLPVDVFPHPQSPFGIGTSWQQPFPMPAIPPWQQQRVIRSGPRPNPLIFVALAFIAFSIVGESMIAILPFVIPLVVLSIVMLRLAARGGRRHPPFR
jgi:hypothetical protein